MRDEVVTDASFLLEPFSTPGLDEALLVAHLQAEHPMSAPQILVWEVGNYFFGPRSARLRRPLAERRERFEATLLGVELVDLAADLRTSAAECADRHGLTFYDASYLALARDRGAALLTHDATMKRAATAEGVPVHDLASAAAAVARGDL